jgi:hypothetical protein
MDYISAIKIHELEEYVWAWEIVTDKLLCLQKLLIQ